MGCGTGISPASQVIGRHVEFWSEVFAALSRGRIAPASLAAFTSAPNGGCRPFDRR